jgi:transposase InsO family protein
MTGNLDLLETKIKAENLSPVTVANGSKVPIDQIGTTTMLSNKISNVLYLPTFASNVISVSKITKELNCNVIFSPENVVFRDRITKKKIGEGSLENGLYILDMSNKALLANNLEQNKLWHWRVVHASDKVLNKMMSVTNLNNSNCDICRFSKQTRLPFSLSNSKTTRIFELVHSDVWGPAPIDSYNNFKYYVTFIDDFSRTIWIYLLKTKDEVFLKFQEFTNFVENPYDIRIKILRSDNGTEYVNKPFSNFLKQKGILHQTTCINTPEQNEISERKNRHILEVTRSLLFQTNVPKRFWSEAVLTAVHLINRLPSIVLKNKSPLEILHKRKSKLDHLRVFGCIYFVHIKRHDKLDKNTVKTIFFGYSSQKKGYKCYDPTSHKLYTSRDVIFFKTNRFTKKKEI